MKKKPARLPRLTVLAYSKRDLAAFVQAVENLRLLVNDLGVFVGTLKAKSAARPRGKQPNGSSPGASAAAAPSS